jgi:lipopolysaccharide transport system permease protein
MLAKINFPREAIIVSGIYQTLFNAGIKIALLLFAVIWFGIAPGWEALLIPVGVLSLILVGTVIGLLVTPIGLLYQDIGRGLPLLLQFLMYSTPVVFAIPPEGIAATLFRYNPLTPVIETSRAWLTGQQVEMLAYFLIVNLVVAVFLLVVWVIYRLAMPILIERMSA